MTKLSNHCWVGCLKFRGQFGEEDGEEWCANESETASRRRTKSGVRRLLDEEVTPTPLTLFNLFNGQAAFCLGLNSKSPASGSNSAGGARIVTRRLCGSHHLGLI